MMGVPTKTDASLSMYSHQIFPLQSMSRPVICSQPDAYRISAAIPLATRSAAWCTEDRARCA